MNTFYFQFSGNKRTELTHILPEIQAMNVRTIVEPFAGSCAVSRALADTHGVYIADIDKNLTTFCNIFHQDADVYVNEANKFLSETDWTRETYLKRYKETAAESVAPETLPRILAMQKYRTGIAPGRPPMKNGTILPPPVIRADKFKSLNKFFSENHYHNEPYSVAFSKFRDDSSACIFLDPPYLSTTNDAYKMFSLNTTELIWRDVLDLFNNSRCGVVLCVKKDMWMDLAFHKWHKKSYAKLYSVSQSAVVHSLYVKGPTKSQNLLGEIAPQL